MKPQQGEFWIVEFEGRTTVGRCSQVSDVIDGWTLIGHELPILTTGYYSLRAVRKIDVAALLDRPAAASLSDGVPMTPGFYWVRVAGIPQPIVAELSETSAKWFITGVDMSIDDVDEVIAAVAPSGTKIEDIDREYYQGKIAELQDQLGGVQRILWLVIRAAGAPGGVQIDLEDQQSFDHTRAQLYAETDTAGNIHVEARLTDRA